MHFDPKTHTYTHNGKRLQSVTKILVHSGIIDTSFLSGVEYLDRGNSIHELTAKFDNNERVDLRYLKPRWRGHYHAWLRYRVESTFKPRLIEHRVHCDDYGYGGTLDRLGNYERHPKALETISDIKNAKTGKVGDWVRYQLVGYGHAYDPKKLFERVGVCLHADGTYSVTVFPVYTWYEDLEKFLGWCKQAHDGQSFMDFCAPRR